MELINQDLAAWNAHDADASMASFTEVRNEQAGLSVLARRESVGQTGRSGLNTHGAIYSAFTQL
jgi:hypothetical protein